MRKVTIGTVQMQMQKNVNDNIDKADKLLREAAKNGAEVILLPELF